MIVSRNLALAFGSGSGLLICTRRAQTEFRLQFISARTSHQSNEYWITPDECQKMEPKNNKAEFCLVFLVWTDSEGYRQKEHRIYFNAQASFVYLNLDFHTILK